MKKYLVIGLGVSGRSAARFLLARGESVVALEKNRELTLKEEGLEIIREFEGFDDIQALVISSGIRCTHPLVALAKEKGIEVISEADLALKTCTQKCVGITGTNGKTTVTLLVEHVLKQSGKKALSLGNVGIPLTEYFLKPDPEEILVIELSSYQLETLSARVFDAGVILNITPDHLDQYSSMNEYAEAKCRLQFCMKENAPLYVNANVLKDFGHFLSNRSCCNIRTFDIADFLSVYHNRAQTGNLDSARQSQIEVKRSDRQTPAPSGQGEEEEQFGKVAASPNFQFEFDCGISYRHLGTHEIENATSAWLLVEALGISREQFIKAFETFKKPPHRIEFVTEIDGISYFDDSKGTNVDAVVKAVQAMKAQVILIAGGVDKGSGYGSWIEPFKGKVKRLITIGEAAPRIEAELKGYYEMTRQPTLEEAVKAAAKEAAAGDCVLLSPGCSSFDMFRDYAHRGEEFKRCVLNLRRGL